MELLYNLTKKMDVVNITDGKHLGKISDMLFDYPENRIRGFYVTGGKGFHFTKQDLFVPLSAVIRIGEDVILTDLNDCLPQKCKKNRSSQPCPPKGAAQGNANAAPYSPHRGYDEYE